MDEAVNNLARFIGRRVRKARLEKHLTGAELARKVSKSQAFLSDVERGRKLPSLITLLMIAKELKHSPEFFLPDTFLYKKEEQKNAEQQVAEEPSNGRPASFLEVLTSYMVREGYPWALLEDQVGLSVEQTDLIRQGFTPPPLIIGQIADYLGVKPDRLLKAAGYATQTVSTKALVSKDSVADILERRSS